MLPRRHTQAAALGEGAEIQTAGAVPQYLGQFQVPILLMDCGGGGGGGGILLFSHPVLVGALVVTLLSHV